MTLIFVRIDECHLFFPGLWALRFGNGAAAGPTDSLFFTAGTAGESAGLFGSLTFSGQGKHDA
jgi:hypothetical protein